jgi:hypothetical protein
MKLALSAFFGTSRIMPETYRITSIRRSVAVLTLATLGLAPVCAEASLPRGDNQSTLTSVAAAPGGGFWVQIDSTAGNFPSGTFPKEGAPVFDSISERGSIAAIPGRNGYWVVSSSGKIVARGDAPQLCEGHLSTCSGFPERPYSWQYIVAAAATPTGLGLWAVGRDGKVWAAGDAKSFGDVQSETIDNPFGDALVPTGIAATEYGEGYYIVMADGGVFTFGDAVFFGSTGGKRPEGHNVTGIALYTGLTAKTAGYWLVAEDGAVYTFGSAPFWGNAGITDWKVTSIVSFPALVTTAPREWTRGYAWVFDNGEVRAVYGPSR